MKVLFVMRHAGFLRHYESVVALLAERGHAVHLAIQADKQQVVELEIEELCRDHAAITCGPFLCRKGVWGALLRVVRNLRDYLRYLHPRYARAGKLAGRAREQAGIPGLLLALLVYVFPVLRSERGLRLLDQLFRFVEDRVPADPAIMRAIRDHAADVVLVTPLIDFGSGQLDCVKAARSMGIPVGLCVASWDNLTNKGLIQLPPDRIILWNEDQKREAIELHEMPADIIRITGAQSFDKWFEYRPSTTRDAFCNQTSLDPGRPIILYLCSSGFIAEQEAGFVQKWLEHLQSRGEPILRDAQVLVRPHPLNAGHWTDVELAGHPAVVWPREGAYMTTARARADYFDSMYHSTAVVGINTSGLIEAGIVGRICHTIMAPEFALTQEGTLHFEYLVRDGYLQIGHDFTEHFSQLAVTLATNLDDQRAHGDRFVQSFVRPQGRDVPSTPLVADAVEELGQMRVASPPPSSAALSIVRAMLWPVAVALAIGEKTARLFRWLFAWAGKRVQPGWRSAEEALFHRKQTRFPGYKEQATMRK